MDNRERGARRQLREAKRQLHKAQMDWADEFLTDDDESATNWARAGQLKESVRYWEEQAQELEANVLSEFGDRRPAQRTKTRRGRPASPANPGFNRIENDIRSWLVASVNSGEITEDELSEIARECELEYDKLSDFSQKDSPSSLKGAEIVRLKEHCQQYFNYRLLGDRSAENLLRFLFWYQRSMEIPDSEISRLTRLSTETLRKWRSGESEPDLLPILSCFDALDLSLVPVPNSKSRRFLASGYLWSKNRQRKPVPI